MLDTIFYSFWTFLGTVILIGVTCDGLSKIIRAVRGTPEPKSKDDDGVVDADYRVIR